MVGTGCGGGQGWWCVLSIGGACKGAVVRLMSCNAPGLKASRLLWANTLEGSRSVPLGYCSGKEAVFVVVVGSGYLSVFVWVVGSCLAMSGHQVLVGIDVYREIVCYFIHGGISLASALLCSRVGQDVSQLQVLHIANITY